MMTDYKKMYLILCERVANALDEIEGKPQFNELFHQLQGAMLAAEEVYVDTSDDEDRETESGA